MTDFNNLLGGAGPQFSANNFDDVEFPEQEQNFTSLLNDPNISRIFWCKRFI